MQSVGISYPIVPLFKHLHSTILFRQLQALELRWLDDGTHVLPYLEQIKELQIWKSDIPVYSLDVDLPLVHTLQQLRLHESTFPWMLGRSFKSLRECILYYPKDTFEESSKYDGLQVDLPACTALTWECRSMTFFPFSAPNIQLLQWSQDEFNDVALKSLHDFFLSCPCLQGLEISIPHCPGQDYMIQLVFCGVWEQRVWQDIRSVAVKACFGWSETRDHFFSQMVRWKLHYGKWWKEFTVTKGDSSPLQVILSASM